MRDSRRRSNKRPAGRHQIDPDHLVHLGAERVQFNRMMVCFVYVRNGGIRLDVPGDTQHQIAEIRQLGLADRAAPVHQLQRDTKARIEHLALGDRALPFSCGQRQAAHLHRLAEIELALPQTIQHGGRAGFGQAAIR